MQSRLPQAGEGHLRGAGHTQRQGGAHRPGLSEQAWVEGGESSRAELCPRTVRGPRQMLSFERVKIGGPGEVSRSECWEGRGQTNPGFRAGESHGQMSVTQRSAWGKKGARARQGFGTRMSWSLVWLLCCVRCPRLGGFGEVLRKGRVRPG